MIYLSMLLKTEAHGTTIKPAYSADYQPKYSFIPTRFSNVNFDKGVGKQLLEKTLKLLSPKGESFTLGATTRISITDSRDIPTICMPYSAESGVPIIHASSAIKRILSLAYMLVWAWLEHQAACKLRDEEPTRRITFLIDEVEAHLHPRRQRTILSSLMESISNVMGKPEVKLILTTHSPLVMASCEDVFADKSDRWFDLDYDKGTGQVLQRSAYADSNSRLRISIQEV